MTAGIGWTPATLRQKAIEDKWMNHSVFLLDGVKGTNPSRNQHKLPLLFWIKLSGIKYLWLQLASLDMISPKVIVTLLFLIVFYQNESIQSHFRPKLNVNHRAEISEQTQRWFGSSILIPVWFWTENRKWSVTLQSRPATITALMVWLFCQCKDKKNIPKLELLLL